VADEGSARNPVNLGPFENVVGVAWGGGPIALIEVTGAGAALDVLDAIAAATSALPFPVRGQPGDTINPNTYRKRNFPLLAGFAPAPLGDLVHGDQGVWFGYGSVPGTYTFDDATIVIEGPAHTPPPNDGTRTVTPPGHDPIPAMEYLDADFVPQVNLPADQSKNKFYYLVDFGTVRQLQITNGSIAANTFTYDTVIEVPDRNITAAVEQPGWILIDFMGELVQGRWALSPEAPVSRYQPVQFDFPSRSEIVETTRIDVAGAQTTTTIKVYSGGIFRKSGNDVTWAPWPPNPKPDPQPNDPPYTDGGKLLWSAALSAGASATFDKAGAV
jgi:hypothetical protein